MLFAPNIYGVPNKANKGRIAIQPDIYNGISKENRDATANGSESLLLFSQITFRKFMSQIVAIFSTK